MKHKFFRIPVYGGPFENELNQFTSANRVVGTERHLVMDGANSHWAICLRYLEASQGAPALRKGKVDYRDVLTEDEFACFAKLRELRKGISEQEGLPPYALFTNEQLLTRRRA